MDRVLFSSLRDDWETPKDLFYVLDSEFHFDLDPCSSISNHLCDNFFTMEDDGLSQSWAGHTVFCNPPFGRKIYYWIQKCYLESVHSKIVLLCPARTDTKWFHSYIYHVCHIRFIPDRLYFTINGVSVGRSPFPSMVCVFPDPKK